MRICRCDLYTAWRAGPERNNEFGIRYAYRRGKLLVFWRNKCLIVSNVFGVLCNGGTSNIFELLFIGNEGDKTLLQWSSSRLISRNLAQIYSVTSNLQDFNTGIQYTGNIHLLFGLLYNKPLLKSKRLRLNTCKMTLKAFEVRIK